jgi:hypothetical protein
MVVGTIQFKLLEIQAIFFFLQKYNYPNVISTKKMLVAFESFMEVAQSNMDIAKAFLHHGYIDVCGCCIWV